MKLNRHGHPRFYQILKELAELHSRKNKDYASKKNPLQNFNRVAEMCHQYKLITEGNESVKVCMIYALKQIDATLKLLGSNEKGDIEGIPERLRDVAVYCILAEILYEENVCVK